MHFHFSTKTTLSIVTWKQKTSFTPHATASKLATLVSVLSARRPKLSAHFAAPRHTRRPSCSETKATRAVTWTSGRWASYSTSWWLPPCLSMPTTWDVLNAAFCRGRTASRPTSRTPANWLSKACWDPYPWIAPQPRSWWSAPGWRASNTPNRILRIVRHPTTLLTPRRVCAWRNRKWNRL